MARKRDKLLRVIRARSYLRGRPKRGRPRKNAIKNFLRTGSWLKYHITFPPPLRLLVVCPTPCLTSKVGVVGEDAFSSRLLGTGIGPVTDGPNVAAPIGLGL